MPRKECLLRNLETGRQCLWWFTLPIVIYPWAGVASYISYISYRSIDPIDPTMYAPTAAAAAVLVGADDWVECLTRNSVRIHGSRCRSLIGGAPRGSKSDWTMRSKWRFGGAFIRGTPCSWMLCGSLSRGCVLAAVLCALTSLVTLSGVRIFKKKIK